MRSRDIRLKLPSILSRRIFWITLISLVWLIIFALNLAPILLGPTDWAWNFKPVLERYRTAPLIIGMLIYLPVGLWLKYRRSVTGLLVWAVLGGIFLTLGAVHLRGDILYRLYTISVSGRAAGWHMAAARIEDLSATLHAWPQFMLASESYSPHIDHTPPGIVLIYYAAGQILDRLPELAKWLAGPVRWQLCQYLTNYTDGQYAAAWLGMLMPLWGSLTVIPLYYLGRQVFSQEVAEWSTLWWPLIPSFLIFAPLPNTFYALPSVLVILLLWKGLRDDKLGWVAAAGAAMSVLSFLTFTYAPLLLFSGLLTLAVYWQKSRSQSTTPPRWHWPLRMGVGFGLGLSTVWLIYYAATGSSFWSIWNTAQQTQTDVAAIRPYLPWLVFDVNDLLMFIGWPLSLLALWGCGSVLRRAWRRREPTAGDAMTLAALATLIIIDLYGTPRGETGRILLFLAPWLLYAAATALQDHSRGAWLLTGAQGLIAVVMIICLQVLAPEFRAHAAPAPPVISYPAANSAQNYVSTAKFGDVIRLVSYAGKVESQGGQNTITLWVRWKDLQPVGAAYNVSVVPVAPDGTISDAAYMIPPMQDKYPTSCWRPSDGNLVDRIKIPLPSAQAGDWWAQLSLINAQTGLPLEILGSDGQPTQETTLGPFH